MPWTGGSRPTATSSEAYLGHAEPGGAGHDGGCHEGGAGHDGTWDGGRGGRGSRGSVGCGSAGHQSDGRWVGRCVGGRDGGRVGSGGGEVGAGGRGAGADSVGADGRDCSDRFRGVPSGRSRFTGRRSAGTPGAASATGGSAPGVAAGETITGPVGGSAMNGIALSGAPGPAAPPASVGVPAPIATRIGSEAMVASMITTTASRRRGPVNPGPRWRPARQRWRAYSGTAVAWRITPNFASAAERVGMPSLRPSALGDCRGHTVATLTASANMDATATRP